MPAQTGNDVLDALHRFAALLADNEDRLNALNVFPIADRDTGTNLVRTIDRLLVELNELDGAIALGPLVARAALSAARGNSGLICSQYLAGFAEIAMGSDVLDGVVLSRAMATGACAARAAVSRPVEGTMLTVADAAAERGAFAASESRSAAEVIDQAHRRSLEALDETTGQLDVLAAAGVVDAGAAGLVLFFEALAATLGVEPAGPERRGSQESHSQTSHSADRERFVGFELQFTADGPEELADELRALLDRLGTDVVVSWAAGVARAHVHLDDAGPAIEAVLDRARPRNIIVEALMERTDL